MTSKIDILRNIQNKKCGGFEQSFKMDQPVGIVKKKNSKKVLYLNCTETSKTTDLTVYNDNYTIEPYIPIELNRWIVFLSGPSGSGKTCLSSILINQFLDHYKNRNAYYLCQTSKNDDPNLRTIKRLKQLDPAQITDLKVEDMKNSLVVIDDTDFHSDHKTIMKWVNTLVECGRKWSVNIIYSSHVHSKCSESPIYKEVNLYITFPDALINNRMLNTHLKIPENIILNLSQDHHAFIAFNNFYKTIITDRTVSKYN